MRRVARRGPCQEKLRNRAKPLARATRGLSQNDRNENRFLFTCKGPVARVRPMAVQVGVSPFGSSRESVLALARRAADSGLDGLILGDGFVSTPSFPVWSGGLDCFVELAWLAGHVDMPTYGIHAVVA